MRRRHLLVFAVLFSVATPFTSLIAQSTSLNLAAQLTDVNGRANDDLGYSVAISGDSVVAIDWYPTNKAFVFQRSPGGWVSGTQTSELTPSDGGTFYGPVVMSGDTVVIGGAGKLYIYVKPQAGWRNMTEVARLSAPTQSLAFDGDTILSAASDAAYVFVKPSGGWATTSSYDAKLTFPGQGYFTSIAFSGDTAVASFTGGSSGGAGYAYVYQKPQGGWLSTDQPTAQLTRAGGTGNGFFGTDVAVYGDTIAVGADISTSTTLGAVDLFVKPESGWTNASQTLELLPPPNAGDSSFRRGLAMNDRHLVVGSESAVFVYAKPAAGWASAAWPSQAFIGSIYSDLSYSIALDGDVVVAGDPFATIGSNDLQGAAYVFPLMPNGIQVSTNVLEFPDLPFGSTETQSLTIANTGSSVLNFTAAIDSASNFQVDYAGSNCTAGVAPGQSCELPIHFNAKGVGQHTSDVTLLSPASGSLRVVRVRGLATGLGPISEAAVDFGSVPRFSNGTRTVTLENFGASSATLQSTVSNNPNFSVISTGTCTSGVAPNDTCNVTILVNPKSSGFHQGSIFFYSTSGSPTSVVVRATVM